MRWGVETSTMEARMRVLQICVVGVAAAYLALSYSQAATGYPQAASFLMAILAATLTVGVAIAVGLHAWPDDAGIGRTLPAHGCHGCGREMVELHSAWVCPRCDRVSAR
ncbi:MAG: hypothetical protein HKO82_08005 [Acidimicrobiia bacterium]|nr:hypothetical protein [Acidimicrobiia bacterium]NNL13613.1 hypothetical protein [Acidimicrobiia bacterium]